ncbi:4970_t:CDS:2 [Diversispora eburnea]|uniref:4970_t:CDS:1 n=2 Tax=Diversisporales TaxID=214509 RepID=A0A9N8YUW0_9GLOM|nr:4970_t:CDS:2 [Diversispora eburnea]
MFFLPDYIPSYVQLFITSSSLFILTTAGLLYHFQCDLIYPSRFPQGSRELVAKPSEYGMNYSEVILKTKDGLKIRAYICKVLVDAKNRPTILYFHANAGNMGHRLPIAQKFYSYFKCNVALVSYRGYGLSEGKANEKGIRIDAQALLDYVLNDEVLKHTKLVAYGQSLGGAVSIDLVSRNEDKFSGLILENTFLSIPKVIPNVIPQLRYIAFLCHQIWPSEKYIQQIAHTPILFLSGKQDEIIPPSHMKELYDISITETKVFKEFVCGSHNDTCMQPDYFDMIGEFLKKEVLMEDVNREWVTV